MATDVNGRESAEQTPEPSETPEHAPEAATDEISGAHEASETDATSADAKTARERIATLLWWSVPSSTDEEAKTRTEQLLDAHRAEVLREAEGKAREVVAKLWRDGATQQRMDRAGGARAVEWEIGRMASGTDEPAEPDFFQPGHVYGREHHGHLIAFHVRCVTPAPDGDYQIALGFRHGPDGWKPFDSDDMDGWTDATAVYPVGGENAQETTR